MRMLIQKSTALHEGNGMRIHLRDVLPVIFGQTHDAVRDAKLMLTHDLHSTFAEQFVVMEKTACNGVFDSNERNEVRVLFHFLKLLLKRVAAHNFYRFIFEKLVGGNVVKTTDNSLNGYFSHYLLLNKKIPLGWERDCYVLFFDSSNFGHIYTYTFPLYFVLK